MRNVDFIEHDAEPTGQLSVGLTRKRWLLGEREAQDTEWGSRKARPTTHFNPPGELLAIAKRFALKVSMHLKTPLLGGL